MPRGTNEPIVSSIGIQNDVVQNTFLSPIHFYILLIGSSSTVFQEEFRTLVFMQRRKPREARKNPHSKDDKRKKARSQLIFSNNKVLTILVKCIYHYLKNLIVNFKVVHLKEVLWKVRQLKEEHVLQKKSKQIGKRFNFLNFKFYTGYHADFCQYLHLSSPITPFYHNHKGNGTRKLYRSTTLQK